jgi:transposase InsO family protein
VLCAAAHNTYVSTWAGTVYTAFTIDVFSRKIVGWTTSMSKETGLVLDTIEMGLRVRDYRGQDEGCKLVHHSDYAEPCVKPRDRVLACAGGVA